MRTDRAPSRADLLKLEKELRALDDKRRFDKIGFFKPYPKQQEFFDLGSIVFERMFRAGNQLGKSEAGAVEVAYHVTGEYPDDWLGFRFEKPVKAWVCGITGADVRDVPQQKLFGKFGVESELGTGFIPKRCIIGKPSMARGVTDAYDTVHIRHKSGGVSSITFKSYEQGREKFQGDPMDLIWLDEEPDMEIYLECIARTISTHGIVFTTFTPLHGRTPLFTYMTDPAAKETRREILMTMYDVPGITQDEINRRLSKFPAYQRETRLMGVPMQGEGRVFVTPEENIREPLIVSIPLQWHKLWAIDFGINEEHKFAAVLIAWDKDNDIIHLLHAFKMADGTPIQDCVQIKQRGIMVPVAWPHDGWGREKGSGEAIQLLYKKQGLKMLPEHATFEDGGYSTEAGIMELDERMKQGRFKVASHLSAWFDEYRDYHRKDGLIVKTNDDILSATRIAIMAKRFGRQAALGGSKPMQTGQVQIAKGTDLADTGDLF